MRDAVAADLGGRRRDADVIVIVIVDVIGPVIVAVHVHGNDTVIVIRPEVRNYATATSTGR